MGQEIFLVSVKKVLEVLLQQAITEVPNTPETIKGVIHFRGDIIPVINSRVKFNMKKIAEIADEVIIVFEILKDNKKIRLSASADLVKDVIFVEANDISPVPEIGLKYNTTFVTGMIKHNDKFLKILDVDKIFSVENSIEIQN